MKRIFLIIGLNIIGFFAFSQPIITTVAGNGTAGSGGDGGAATSANLNAPQGIIADGSGNLYIADSNNNKIRKVSSTGVITTIAGTGTAGYSGDGGAATSAKLSYPIDLAFDPSGNLYICEANNHVIRKINTSGTISTYAGTGGVNGFSGDGGAATSAKLNQPSGIAFVSGDLFIADRSNSRIRKVNSSGTISTIAGTGTLGYSGDGGAATSAQLSLPMDIIIDAVGNIYIADNPTVRKINSSGIISTYIGNGTQSCTGNGGAPGSATLFNAYGMAIDSYGNFFVADGGCEQIREINTLGITITAFAGTGSSGFSGDGGAATLATFQGPYKICFDNSNNMFIADAGNCRIRKITMPYCVASAGSNVHDANTACCGCSTTGVQIGTPAISGLSYSWSPNTNLSSTTIAQPTSTWCNPSIPKTYTVTVSGMCCATSTSTVTVSTTVYGGGSCCARMPNPDSVQTESSMFKVFPNPSNGNVTITWSGKVEYIEITDVMGKVVSEIREVPGNQFDINLSEYGKGTYFILVSIDGILKKEKLIIE
jgi:hypothetical protein